MPTVAVTSFGVSSRFALTRTGAPLLVEIASHAARGWCIAFSPTATDANFSVPARTDGSGAPYAVVSGVATRAYGFVPTAPTLWGRVEVRGAAFAVDSLLAVTSVKITQYTPSG